MVKSTKPLMHQCSWSDDCAEGAARGVRSPSDLVVRAGPCGGHLGPKEGSACRTGGSRLCRASGGRCSGRASATGGETAAARSWLGAEAARCSWPWTPGLRSRSWAPDPGRAQEAALVSGAGAVRGRQVRAVRVDRLSEGVRRAAGRAAAPCAGCVRLLAGGRTPDRLTAPVACAREQVGMRRGSGSGGGGGAARMEAALVGGWKPPRGSSRRQLEWESACAGERGGRSRGVSAGRRGRDGVGLGRVGKRLTQ